MSSSRRSGSGQRGALTLVELLVVIASVAVIFALLLPAVQRVREGAYGMVCRNNLRQIGLAFQNHEQQLGFFPSGGWDWSTPPAYINGQPSTGKWQKAGWGFQILPYVEGVNAWRGGQATNDLARIRVAVGTTNKLFFCPSRRSPQALTISDKDYLSGTQITCALIDYAASNLEGGGVVRPVIPTRIAEITDGTSNTLVAADKRLNLAFLGQPNYDDYTGYTTGFDHESIRRTGRPPLPDYRAASGDGEDRFGSSHPARINAVFADGSVRSISYSIEPAVFSYLGNKNDGQVITTIDF
jgi:prepilin-type processing-associated H-X9-DG protein